MSSNQLTNIVMMIRPSHFGYNKETALDNVYQKSSKTISSYEIVKKALFEFNKFVNVLENAGINVIKFEDDLKLITPDSVFPNNWISTHDNGIIWLYPMFAPNRRIERRQDILNYLETNFQIFKIEDKMLKHESMGKFLEGTGSMVLDRENNIAYACVSNRTNDHLFYQWCENMNFKGISFSANDSGKPIYHTNVLMSICKTMVFICLDAIYDNEQKNELLLSFADTHKEVVNISKSQMNHFLGNVLELQNDNNESYLVMSTTAFNCLNDSQKERINKKMKILHSPLDTIEYFGGGSARCMIAEIFLKPNN